MRIAFHNLLRAIVKPGTPVLTGPVGPHARFNGRSYRFFGGTNYLGLANNWLVKFGAAAVALEYGTSVSASRVTTGTNNLHALLEASLSQLMGTEDACLCGSGGDANRILLSAIARPNDVVICDEAAHTSVAASVPRDVAVRSFRHNDFSQLRRMVGNVGGAIVAVNGVDPLTGDIAQLDLMMNLFPARENVRVVVDDCHGVGVLGRRGRGTLEHCGITSDRVYQTATMSKAFGSHGGFVAGARTLCDRLRKTAAYGGATALPPSVAAASLASVMLVMMRGVHLRKKLVDISAYAAASLNEIGFEAMHHGTPILALRSPAGVDGQQLSEYLRGAGIYLPHIRYPLPTSRGRLRVALTAQHTKKDVDMLVDALRRFS